MAESSPMVHDNHGPSSHPVLVKCPAYRSSGASIHTEKGTWKHDLVYQLWIGKVKVEDLNDYIGVEVPYPDDDGEEQIYVTVQDDINHVEDAYRQMKATHTWLLRNHPEEKFEDRSEVFVEGHSLGIKGGTPDVLFVGQHVVMDLDFKFGQKTVTPWTEQNKSYLFMHLADRPFDQITHIYSGIIQPTIRSEKAWVVEIEYREIEAHGQMMKEIIKSAKSGNAPRFANDKCNYCDHMASCSTLACIVNNRMTEAEKVVDLCAMDTPQLSRFARRLIDLKSLCGAAEQELFLRLQNGEEDEFAYLGETSGRRVWTDEEQAEQVLTSILEEKEKDKMEMYDFKMKSPAAMEKVVGKAKLVREAMAEVVTKTKGRTKLEWRKDAGNK